MKRFAGSRVWITGASSGIGEALAYEFAQAGAHLILSARRANELERVAAKCVGAASTTIEALDLADTPSLAGHAERVLAGGAVDMMVHNGGISQRSRAIDTSLAVDERLMRVNYFGTVGLTKALLPSMVARRAGHFVVVSSVVGHVGAPFRSSYAASKHALHGFFDALRAEHADDGLRVTIVCPGYVQTEVSRNALTGDGGTHGVMDESTSRGLTPTECARQIVSATGRDREEVYVGGAEAYGIYLKRYAPGLLSRFLRRVKTP